jgi:hypothetical protein
VRSATGTTAASTARSGASSVTSPAGAGIRVRLSNRLACTFCQMALAAGSSVGCGERSVAVAA